MAARLDVRSERKGAGVRVGLRAEVDEDDSKVFSLSNCKDEIVVAY